MTREICTLGKKSGQKITYPPPADGPCVLFLCKAGRSANEAAAQAWRGDLRTIGDFTKCKILNRNAARLHSRARGGPGRDRAGPLASLDENLKKAPKDLFSKSNSIFFERIRPAWGSRLNSTQAQHYKGFSNLRVFHRLSQY